MPRPPTERESGRPPIATLPKVGKDVSDHIAAGYGADQLIRDPDRTEPHLVTALFADDGRDQDFPASEPEGGDQLLDRVMVAYKKYVRLPSEHAAVAVTLWTAVTHGLPAFEHATRLGIHSPVKRCGKSRLLEIIEALARKPLATTDASVAALYRTIESAGEKPPTLILDEADRLFGSARRDEDNRDLIALFNNRFRPGKPTIRCVGPQQTPTAFRNYAMAAIAGIGRLPDTIEDRAVNITMRRRMPSESVAKFRLKTDVKVLNKLRDELAAWVGTRLGDLAKQVEDFPDGLGDRAEDAWEPLLSVADAARGPWPKLAREAAKHLAKEAAEADTESLDIRLLQDVHAAFAPGLGERREGGQFLSTQLLIGQLRGIEDAPWGEFDLTPRKLAMRLGRFEVKPGRNSAGTERGYRLEDLKDAFDRYLPRGVRQNPSDASNSPETLASTSDGLKSSRPEPAFAANGTTPEKCHRSFDCCG